MFACEVFVLKPHTVYTDRSCSITLQCSGNKPRHALHAEHTYMYILVLITDMRKRQAILHWTSTRRCGVMASLLGSIHRRTIENARSRTKSIPKGSACNFITSQQLQEWLIDASGVHIFRAKAFSIAWGQSSAHNREAMVHQQGTNMLATSCTNLQEISTLQHKWSDNTMECTSFISYWEPLLPENEGDWRSFVNPRCHIYAKMTKPKLVS